jgi:NAD(P)-dependent dehydrogenase (short-subunit alcohol dehydrogenase family)
LKKSQSPSIVFVSSLNALIGNKNHSAYTYTKGGITSLTRALAVELGKFNIRVNSVCPGSIKTKMLSKAIQSGLEKPVNELKKLYPLKRIGKPDEVAELVYFLSSEKSGFITGAIIPIDGGLSAK